MKYLVKKVSAFAFLLCIFLGTPNSAHAQMAVADGLNLPFNIIGGLEQLGNTLLSTEDFTKEFVLDPAAWIASGMNLMSMAQSMTDWISTGFDGSPGFVTNLQEHLLGVGDQAAQDALQELLSDGRIRSPFSERVIQEAGDAYLRSSGRGVFGNLNQYSLDARCEGGILSGGLSCLREMVRNPLANTEEGFRIAATDEITSRVGTAQTDAQTELSWGDGIQSWRGSCPSSSSSSSGAASETNASEPATDSVSLSVGSNSTNCSILTPASVVLAELNNELGAATQQQVGADELSEILTSSFLSFIKDNVFGEGGLSGGGSNDGRGRGNSSTSEPPAPTPSMVSSFIQVLQSQRARVEEYQTNWQRIKTQAEAAKANLEQCSRTEAQTALNTQVLPVITEATTAVERAATALLAFDDILAQAQSATTAAELQEATDVYDALLAGTEPYEEVSVPGPADLMIAVRESQDTSAGGNDVTQTKFGLMKQLASRSCLAW